MARLGDLFVHIRNGANIKQGLDDSGYPITRIETISNRIVDRNKMGYAGVKDLSKYQDFVLQDGDILMSHINSETHLGKAALYQKDVDETIIHGMNLLSLRPKKDIITSKYAFYYLSSQAFLRQIPNITKKSVNQASFTVSALKKLSFPLVSLTEQKTIIDNLDKVSQLIEERKQQLSKLDKLVKARFVEMFGEVETNTKGFIIKRMDECCKFIGGAQPNKSCFEYEKSENNIRLIQIRDYKSDRFITYIPKSLARKTCTATDIMIGRYGPPIFQILGGIEGAYNVALMKAIPTNEFNMEYFRYFLKDEKLLHYLESFSQRTAGQDGIQIDKLNAYPCFVPPIELQNEFATFVKQIDKSKFEVQQSLEKLETLKKSLMQQYFG